MGCCRICGREVPRTNLVQPTISFPKGTARGICQDCAEKVIPRCRACGVFVKDEDALTEWHFGTTAEAYCEDCADSMRFICLGERPLTDPKILRQQFRILKRET